MASPVTIGVFLGAIYFVLRLQNYRWRLLAASYASGSHRLPTAEKRFAQMVAIGGAPFYTHYVGVTVGVCEDGLSLRLVPPFSVQAPPLFLPFAEMTMRPTSWHLNAESFSIRMARGDVELIVDDKLMSWIRDGTGKFELEM